MYRLFYLVTTLLLLPVDIAGAMEPRWATERYSHFSENEEIAQALRSFAASQRVPIVVSERVEGVLNGRFLDLTPREFLDRMSATYNLTWYYDGNALYLYRADEIQNRILFLNHLGVDELRQSLEQLQVFDDRFGWRSVPERRIVYVSGPPRFVELVEESTQLLDQEFGKREQRVYEVRIFPLRYAWAEDRRVVNRDREVTIPGLATILRNILGDGGREGAGPAGRSDHSLPPTVRKLKGSGLNAATTGEGGDQGLLGPGGRDSFVQADGHLNAVVVRDTQARMPFYAELVKALDVPREQVEIEAVIVDVATNALKDFGFAWQYHNNDQGSIGFGSVPDTPDPDYDTLSAVIGQGASFSTLVGVDYFLARIRALEGKGDARVLARPSVLTLDNLEAELNNSTTFYVRVAGDQEVDLFPVSVGAVLKVTPHVIEQPSDQRVLLDIRIEDGQTTQDTVDGIPVVQSSTIVTQAVVPERRSLLIGGYYRESTEVVGDKVPLLGDIPGIGLMFRHNRDERREMTRLFLITPRIIDPEQAVAEGQARERAERMARGGTAMATSTATPAAAPDTEEATAASGLVGDWWEVATFAQRSNAERLSDLLAGDGVTVRTVERQDLLGFTSHLVQVGGFASCAEIDHGRQEIRARVESAEIGGRYRCRRPTGGR